MAASLSEMRPADTKTAEAEQMTEFKKLLLQAPNTRPSYDDALGYELLKMMAVGYAKSSLVPKMYRETYTERDKRNGEWGDFAVKNENAIPNCMIALNIAIRMNADPLMVMQNLYIVEGRPAWSAQFVIAKINTCGRFSTMRFEMSEEGPETEYEYESIEYVNKEKKAVIKKMRLRNRTCRAYAYEKGTNECLRGAEISMAMAVAEGWYQKAGSKWKTIPEQMLMYRAAAFFGKMYIPDLLMGMPTSDEVEDMTPAHAEPHAAARNEMLEAMRAVERETEASVAAMAAAAPPADMATDTGEIPPPAAQAQQTPPAQQPATAPAPAQQQPATQAPPADEDDGLDDWRVAFDGCQTAADCDDLIASYRGKPGSDEAKALRALCAQQKKKIAADGFGGGE